MAQEYSMTGGQTRQLMTAKNLAVTVGGTGNTTLLEVLVAGLDTISAEFKPTVQAFDAFAIQAKFHADGDFVTLYSTGGSFTSPAGLLIGASGDLTALAAAATGWFVLDVRGLYAVKVIASAAADSALVDVYAGGSGH